MALAVLTTVIMAIMQVVKGNGVVEVKAVRYSSSCTDNWILKTQCDTFFEFCLKKITSPSDSLSQCDLGSYGPTGHYDDRNYIDFTYVTSFPGGIKNPLKFEVRKFETSDLKFVVRVRDDEAQGSEHLAWLTKVFSHRPAAMEQQSAWSSVLTAFSGSYYFLFQFRSYCTPNYYTSACDVYCVAQDNSSGHYTCNQATGAKVCMPGWTGETCTTDIDECAQGICHNGANCTNQPGSYTCDCLENFVGKKCDLVYSLCYSKPCLNGGNCSGNTTYFSCSCGANWTGDTCQTMVNFCQSSSCLNGATCVPIVGNYSCVCPKGWMGSNCETEVNACLSSPCINNGTCIRAAGGEYTCKCSADYGGTHCEKYLDPCLSSPCLNSAQVGSNAASVQDNKNDSPLPIILAICGSFLIAVIIVAVFLIVRRRRKKTEFPDTVHINIREVHNGDDPTVAFDNDLYRHVNMANASLEDSRREKQDLPPSSSPENFINPTTSSVQLLLIDEERGAVGGVDHHYQDIDCCKLVSGKGSGSDKGMETSLKQMSADGKGTDPCLEAGTVDAADDRARANPYEDFEELKRLSRVQRSREEFANNSYSLAEPGFEVQTENPYHDLDEVRQEVQAMQQQILDNIRVQGRFPPLPPPPPPVTPRAIILQTEGYSDLVIDENDVSSEDEAVEQEDIHQLRQEVARAIHHDGPATTSIC